MDEMLQEYADGRGTTLCVDREAGVIRGVKILGFESRNGRRYPPETLTRARDLYEGAKVNVNHPGTHATAPRDYRDRIGVIRNVAFDPAEGLFGDLHFNPKHALAAQLEWDAGHAPENVGLSHNVLARTVRRDDRVVVEAITQVLSVDLVADPATTRGLYEERAPHEPLAERLQTLTVAQLRECRPDLVEAFVAEHRDAATRLRAEADALREALGGATTPRSREQQSIEPRTPVRDVAAFVRAVRG